MSTPATKGFVDYVVTQIGAIRKMDGYHLDWLSATRYVGSARSTTKLPYAEVTIGSVQETPGILDGDGEGSNTQRLTIRVDAVLSQGGLLEFATIDDLVEAGIHDVRNALFAGASANHCSIENISTQTFHGDADDPELGFHMDIVFAFTADRKTGVLQ